MDFLLEPHCQPTYWAVLDIVTFLIALALFIGWLVRNRAARKP